MFWHTLASDSITPEPPAEQPAETKPVQKQEDTPEKKEEEKKNDVNQAAPVKKGKKKPVKKGAKKPAVGDKRPELPAIEREKVTEVKTDTDPPKTEPVSAPGADQKQSDNIYATKTEKKDNKTVGKH